MTTERYTGSIKSIGAAEMGSTGREKPRKVVISDSPTYQGRTFRCWASDSNFDDLTAAANAGRDVTIEYIVEERQGGPSGTYKQNRIVGVFPADAKGDAPAGNQGGDWSVPPASAPAQSQSHPSSQPLSKEDYWARREQRDEERQRKIEERQAHNDAAIAARQAENDYRDYLRSLEQEAAWAVKAALDGDLDLLGDDSGLANRAVEIALVKRQVAQKLKDSPGGTPVSPPPSKLDEKSPGADVAGEAQAVPSSPPNPTGDGETPAPSFTALVEAIGAGKVRETDVIRVTSQKAAAFDYFPPKGIGWEEVEAAPEPLLKAVLDSFHFEMAQV